MPCMLFRNTAHEVQYIPSTCCLCCCSSEHLGGTLGGLDLCEDHLCRLQCIASGEGAWYWRMKKPGRAQWAYGGTELRLRHFLLPDKKKEVITNMMMMITNSYQMSQLKLGNNNLNDEDVPTWGELCNNDFNWHHLNFELTCRAFLKLTARGNHWKLMLGRRQTTFWGPAYFQIRAVSFRVCHSANSDVFKFRVGLFRGTFLILFFQCWTWKDFHDFFSGPNLMPWGDFAWADADAGQCSWVIHCLVEPFLPCYGPTTSGGVTVKTVSPVTPEQRE